MDKIVALGFICSTICLIGFYLAYTYGHKTKKFKWSEYFLIIIWPLISIAILSVYIDQLIIKLFLVSMIAGMFFEYFLGFIYEKTLNQKLWKYNKFSISGYTSLLSIPLWGVAGVIFWSLGQIIGL